MDLPNTSGIYMISKDDIQYIGQAQNIRYRVRKHFEALHRGNHRNARLQNTYNKYGKDCFEVHVLNECTIFELDQYEQEWLHLLLEYPKEYTFNQCFEPKTTRGYKFTDQQRIEQSQRLLGKKKPIDFGDKISKANKLKWSSGVMTPKKRREFMIVSPTGILYQAKGISEFADRHNLSIGALHSVITGKHKQHRSWRYFPLI